MWQQSKPLFDAASAISIGRRDCQEDAVISDCPRGDERGLIVLSDGMGGHAAGDVASKIVMTEVFSELKLQAGHPDGFDGGVRDALVRAAEGANDCLRVYCEQYPESRGMGATLVAAFLDRDRLNWVSIGDSGLFLFRRGKLRQLNEDHSLGAEMDRMVREGKMPPEMAAGHPDRNCLFSVISGRRIARMDCPEKGVRLSDGDIVIVASDGLQHLGARRIEEILTRFQEAPSVEIAGQFLNGIETLADPDQDNVSVAVVKVRMVRDAALAAPQPPRDPTGKSTEAPQVAIARPAGRGAELLGGGAG